MMKAMRIAVTTFPLEFSESSFCSDRVKVRVPGQEIQSYPARFFDVDVHWNKQKSKGSSSSYPPIQATTGAHPFTAFITTTWKFRVMRRCQRGSQVNPSREYRSDSLPWRRQCILMSLKCPRPRF
ncbi:hypothetical protein BIW11_11178 [Tropilaelaps mercedesae]|uniref:Uncharacterized protein n=1 Tax=Tropilaelaps mercedesae TaxID=418985 RepID=A0A1V9XCS0_9ACAR|nr:hypothetical protein BIW11_11178 [Tropilaelaps mercedesae]